MPHSSAKAVRSRRNIVPRAWKTPGTNREINELRGLQNFLKETAEHIEG